MSIQELTDADVPQRNVRDNPNEAIIRFNRLVQLPTPTTDDERQQQRTGNTGRDRREMWEHIAAAHSRLMRDFEERRRNEDFPFGRSELHDFSARAFGSIHDNE